MFELELDLNWTWVKLSVTPDEQYSITTCL